MLRKLPVMPENYDRINIYLPEGFRERLRQLAEKFEREGEDVRDNRGNISISAAIRIMVEREEQRPEKAK